MSPVLFASGEHNRHGVTQYSSLSTLSIAGGAQAVNLSAVGALSFLVWDILITMDDEVALVWPRSWSFTKAIYFFVRYFPVLVQLSLLLIGSDLAATFGYTDYDCYLWRLYQGVATSLIIAAVDVVLILRVYALYHGNLIMRCLVGFFFLFEVTGMITGLVTTLPGITYDSHGLCVIIGMPRALITYAGSCILFQTFLFGVTLYKFIRAAKSGWGDIPLVILLVRDGTWAFFLLFILYGAQMGLYRLPDRAYAGVLYSWLMTGFSFSGYRILLNINRLADVNSSYAHNSNDDGRTDTNIQFSTGVLESHMCRTDRSYDQTVTLTTRTNQSRRSLNRTISYLSLG